MGLAELAEQMGEFVGDGFAKGVVIDCPKCPADVGRFVLLGFPVGIPRLG
jgi:hypothetical protein